MRISDIPRKDIDIIRGVADHLARRNKVNTYSDEDLVQELTMIGMEGYVRYWNEDKQKGKVEAKRDNNLRIYMRNFLSNRLRNIVRTLQKPNRDIRVNVTSIDMQDEKFQSIFSEGETDVEFDLEALGVTEEQLQILLYIAGNGLGIRGATGSTKKDMAKALGMEMEKIDGLMSTLRDNDRLRDLLLNRLS
jgi:hypothetical protein